MNRVDRSSRGIVLLMVLGILALMSVLAVSFVQLSRMERAISSSYVQRTRAGMIAESGLEYAVARLGDMAGIFSPADVEELLYIENPLNPGLKYADKLSFQMAVNPPGTASTLDDRRSGIVGSSLADHSDFFKLAVTEESSKLNLNDTNNPWNIDTDPWLDGGADDPDLGPDAPPIPNRLTAIVQELGTILFGSELTGADIANTLFDELQPNSRPNLPGQIFASMDQVHDLLVPAVLSEGEYKMFADNVTIYNWQDPNVLRPTFQLAITAPDPVPADEFDVYIYSDFQTHYFELEPRSPVNVNTASYELLLALIRPIQGWYLYEGAPCSFMDGSYGPWNKCMRHMGRSYKDKATHNGYPGTHYFPMEDGIWDGVLSPHERQSDSKNWNLGRGTRYGQAQLTASFEPVAESLAKAIHARIHDEGQPFRTWDEFSRFIYAQVDTGAVITALLYGNSQLSTNTPLDIDLTSDDEASRFPYRYDDDCSFSTTALPIAGFDRYMADALLANFNPNSQLNDHNPDFHIFRHVDKTQLTQHTTELSFCPTGDFSIRSMGLILDEDGREQGVVEIDTVMRVYHLLRHTSQAQFMKGYRVSEPSSIYNLFQESYGVAPTSGADLLDGEGSLAPGGRWGPSVTSYPDPVRLPGSLSVEDNPLLKHAAGTSDYFSKYEGYLMLSTYELDTASWQNYFPTAPQFLAPMGYRNLGGESAAGWKDRSLAAGGIMPVRYGQNASGIDDDKDTMNIAGGRAAVLAWIQDYTVPTQEMSQEQQDMYDAIMEAFPDYPDGAPQALIDLVNGLFSNCPARSTRYEAPPAWVHDAPWERLENWNEVHQDATDHWQFAAQILMPLSLGFAMPRYTQLWRPGWNMPSELPVTPDLFPGQGEGKYYPDISGGQVQGNLFPDGVFSETGRLLSYPSSNMGSLAGSRGTIAFWFKPHWDTGFSNRIRSIFNMGDLSSSYTHGIDLIYFPASKRQDGLGGRETDIGAGLGYSSAVFMSGPWSNASHSFFCGWLNANWNVSLWGHGQLQESRYVNSHTATDFFPMRDIDERGFHQGLNFYGHQWNLAAITYDGKEYRKYNSSISGAGGVNDVDYSINGREITNTEIVGEYLDLFDLAWQPIVDFWWEETYPVHLAWCDPDTTGWTQIEPEPVGIPKNLQMGERYMRFGWQSENSGPTGDSTYDDITAWAGFLSLAPFESLWTQGRYCGEPLYDEGGSNVSAAGLFTSAPIDLNKEIAGLSLNSNTSLVLKSVMWTGYWPRYNWRPSGAEAQADHTLWSTWPEYSGLQGVDVAPGTDDPVTGDWDPFTVDVRLPGGTWLISGDTDADNLRLFENMDKMAAGADGSKISSRATYNHGESFQYRVYFHNELGESLLESPVLDDITFLFTSSKPVILTYLVVN